MTDDGVQAQHSGEGQDGSVRFAGSTDFPSSVLMDPDAYFKKMVPTDTRPGVWRWNEIAQMLDDMEAQPKRYPEYRRFAALVNQEWEGAPGTTPNIFIGVQRIKVGEHMPGHRHNSVAIYFWIQGTGHAIIDGVRVPFSKGDVFTCPAWHNHSFVNDGDDDMVMLAVHDLPLLAQARALFWEEPIGHENIQHMVRGTAVSWNTQEDSSVVENAPSLTHSGN